MAAMRFVPEPGLDRVDTQACHQQEVLRRAVEKVVVLGKQKGVSAEQMVELLESGLTVKELLEYLISRETCLA